MHNADAATSNGSLVENFNSVTAPDDTTLVITTKQPQANMLYLSIPVSGIPIVPEHVWKSHVADLKNYRNMDFPVVGYGPFVLTGYKTNQYADADRQQGLLPGRARSYDKVVTQLLREQRRGRGRAEERRARPDQRAHLGAVQRDVRASSDMHDLPDAVQRLDRGRDQLRGQDPQRQADRHRQPDPQGHPGPTGDRARRSTGQSWSPRCSTGNGVVGAGYLPPGYPQFFWKPSPSEALDYDPAQAKQMLDAGRLQDGPERRAGRARRQAAGVPARASTPTTRPTPRSRRTSRSG